MAKNMLMFKTLFRDLCNLMEPHVPLIRFRQILSRQDLYSELKNNFSIVKEQFSLMSSYVSIKEIVQRFGKF